MTKHIQLDTVLENGAKRAAMVGNRTRVVGVTGEQSATEATKPKESRTVSKPANGIFLPAFAMSHVHREVLLDKRLSYSSMN